MNLTLEYAFVVDLSELSFAAHLVRSTPSTCALRSQREKWELQKISSELLQFNVDIRGIQQGAGKTNLAVE